MPTSILPCKIKKTSQLGTGGKSQKEESSGKKGLRGIIDAASHCFIDFQGSRCFASAPQPLDLPHCAMQYRISVRKPSVTVRVPATTANLGPGFDTLGIALKLHNQISLREMDEPLIERVDGQRDSASAQAMTREAAAAFFVRSHVKPHGAQIEV